MTHLKRLNMPEMWPLPRKQKTFVITPMPGPHPKFNCIPLQVILRDVTKLAINSREARQMIITGKMLVDKKERKEPRFAAGLMDIIEIPEAKEHYRIDVSKRGLYLRKISAEECGSKLCRIQGKRKINKGITQLNLHDGRNILVEKGKGNEYFPGDSILIQLPGQKIIKSYKLQKGAAALVFSGRNKGSRGTIKEIINKTTMLGRNKIIIKTKEGKEIETLKDYVMVGET